jgi:predicted  nucleic acid-binding Zn-ribbon protein
MGLWERVSDRREKHKQKQRDSKQDGEIKQLRQQFDEAQRKGQERQDEIDRLKSGRPRDEVGDNFERNGAMVQTMYDDMYGRMGSRFARGDG